MDVPLYAENFMVAGLRFGRGERERRISFHITLHWAPVFGPSFLNVTSVLLISSATDQSNLVSFIVKTFAAGSSGFGAHAVDDLDTVKELRLPPFITSMKNSSSFSAPKEVTEEVSRSGTRLIPLLAQKVAKCFFRLHFLH